MLTLRALLEPSSLSPGDRPVARGIRPALAQCLDEAVTPGSVTLEIGAGLSTLVILRKQPRQHTAVQPRADEFAAILTLAVHLRMGTHGFLPILARSQDWLPRSDLPDLDLVLVNGSHDFPMPMLDWFGAEKLKAGGLMVVDDTHLLTGATLVDFMGGDPGWEEVVRDDASHFAIYRKRGGPVSLDDGAHRPSVGPRLACVEVRGWSEYRRYRAAMRGEHRRREAVELSLIDSAAERFEVDGYCAVCRRSSRFGVGFTYSYQKTTDGRPIPNWREHLVCACGFSNRIRAAIQILRQEICPEPYARIYLTERVTWLYQWLRAHYPNLVGTEYLGDRIPRGAEHEGVRNEDLTALTFADESFDLILSFDVMEHVADENAALKECLRCLRPGGILLLGVPFRLDSADNVERARVRSDGTVEHLMPPEYHWQPLTSESEALSFRDFGWRVLDQMREVGFADPRALLYWSLELGYLGADQVLLMASRPDPGAGRR
jgi:SAM-dependent methyltransferase